MMMEEFWLRELYEAYYKQVYRLAANRLYAYTGSSAEAQDVVQEVFLLAAQKDIHDHPNPGGWLAVTINYICMNYHKADVSYKKKIHNAVDSISEVNQQLATTDTTGNVDLKLTLKSALSSEDYKIIVDHYIYGRALADIAEEMTISYVTLRVRIHRIRKQLKKYFLDL